MCILQGPTIEDKTPERRSQSVAVTLISPTGTMISKFITDYTLRPPQQSLAVYSGRSITPHAPRHTIKHDTPNHYKQSALIKVYIPNTTQYTKDQH